MGTWALDGLVCMWKPVLYNSPSSTHIAPPTRAPPSRWPGSAAGPASVSSTAPWPSAPPGGGSALLLASAPLPLSSKMSRGQNNVR